MFYSKRLFVLTVGMALAYCSTLCVVSNMRNKEDSWNHTIAGMAAGTVLGAKSKYPCDPPQESARTQCNRGTAHKY